MFIMGVVALTSWIELTPSPTNPSHVSSEYNFFNTSPIGKDGGLAVPASCPSDLHDDPTYGQPCTSAANICGMTTSGSYQCGGVCDASPPLDSACPCTAEYYAGFECNSPFNVCGEYNRGPVNCDGSCSVPAPPDRDPCVACVPDNSCAASTCVGQSCTNNCGTPVPGTLPADNSCAASTCFNATCTNSCGELITGTYPGDWNNVSGNCADYGMGVGTVTAEQNSCDGTYRNIDWSSCTLPPVCTPPVNDPCTSAPNNCGDTIAGTIQADCSCDARQPADRPGVGNLCQSGPNSCGMQNNGSIQCDMTCDASVPPDTLCVSCGNSACDPGETCFTCPADCAADPSTDTPCESNPNACGMTNSGRTLCDGSCNAATPDDSLCPSPTVCGDGVQEGVEECDTGVARGACPATCSNTCTNNTCGVGINGVCGSSHMGTYSSAPASGLCDTGSATAVSALGGFWNWDCLGSGGGSDDNCWAIVDAIVCGDGDREGSEACDNGASNGTCPASCSSSCTDNTCVGRVDGVCNANHYNCNAGTSINNTDGATQWTWDCQGSGGGNTVACSESKPVVGPPQCDLTHYNCTSGTSSGGVDLGASWMWWCTEAGYADVVCSELKGGASGAITSITPSPCFIAVGSANCVTRVSWTTSGAIVPVLEIPGASPANIFGPTGVSQAFTIPRGTHTITLRDMVGPVILDTASVTAQCITGSDWNGSLCVAAPIVNLTINGSAGPIAASPGDNLAIRWTVANSDATTTCTASGPGWAGAKSQFGGGPDNVPASVSGTYTLTCTKPPLAPVVSSVNVNLSCPVSCTAWTACGPPCVGGNGTQSRSCTTATCVVSPENRSCTTDICRDLNWKEVGQ
ncbi:MAG: hypothetical protein E6R05_06030 [Candidatus Moraniibacteriota bacterium]|nr:MAG: hypothetical protein E6R05_06030 [Candidatus Moranbacteria bacterium]